MSAAFIQVQPLIKQIRYICIVYDEMSVSSHNSRKKLISTNLTIQENVARSL